MLQGMRDRHRHEVAALTQHLQPEPEATSSKSTDEEAPDYAIRPPATHLAEYVAGLAAQGVELPMNEQLRDTALFDVSDLLKYFPSLPPRYFQLPCLIIVSPPLIYV